MKGRRFIVVLFFALVLTGRWMPTAFAQSIMVEKNLFSPDRKPPSNEPVVNSASKHLSGLPPKSIQLDGIFIHQGKRTALLRVRKQLLGDTPGADRNPFPYLTVHEGGSVGDFQVLKIDPSSVTIARNGQQFVISLFAEGKIVPPAAPLPALPSGTPADQNQQSQRPQKAQGGQRAPVPGSTTTAGGNGRRIGNSPSTRSNLKGAGVGTAPSFIPPGVNPRQNVSVSGQTSQ